MIKKLASIYLTRSKKIRPGEVIPDHEEKANRAGDLIQCVGALVKQEDLSSNLQHRTKPKLSVSVTIIWESENGRTTGSSLAGSQAKHGEVQVQ